MNLRIFPNNRLTPNGAIDVISILTDRIDLKGFIGDGECPLCTKSMKVEAGEKHATPAIARMEKLIYDLIDWKTFYLKLIDFLGLDLRKAIRENVFYKSDGQPFSIQKMQAINKFIVNELAISPETVEAVTVRTWIVGNILARLEREGKGETIRMSLTQLPASIKEAGKKFVFTLADIRAIQFAKLHLGEAITQIGEKARHEVAKHVINAQMEGWSHRKLKDMLFQNIVDTEANLNRDWQNVAITEANSAASNGYLASVPAEQTVEGWSHPDACEWCKKNIHEKIFTVRKESPPAYDHLDPNEQRYKEIAQIWENEVWVGKNNVGRSISPNKRSEEGLIPRAHHELAMPAIPAHPWCRCRWIRKV